MLGRISFLLIGIYCCASGVVSHFATNGDASSQVHQAGHVAADPAGGPEATDASLSTNDVMRFAMTQGLCKKVAKKKATEQEQLRLVSLFQQMAANDPPQGSHDSWEELTSTLVDAAQEIADGKPSHKKLGKAANCVACHKPHRPKKN